MPQLKTPQQKVKSQSKASKVPDAVHSVAVVSETQASWLPPLDVYIIGKVYYFSYIRIAVLFAASKILFRYGPVFQTTFDINDPSISRPHRQSTISMSNLTIIYLYVPLALLILHKRLFSVQSILHSKVMVNFLASCVRANYI
jgi:hypothetical protein